ncbi:hypothetical protein [Pseudorhodoferax sp.]|uniref:hypothetical protein n=1 Tax=Pseudorhodoferax sp. TaxID=1993553 RepID=UPI0039E6E205
MSEYRVTAVCYRSQQLTALQLGEGEGPGQWTQEPHEAGVDEVVARIRAGDTVCALLRDETRVDVGPRLKVVEDEQGQPTLALDNLPDDCLELADLERF